LAFVHLVVKMPAANFRRLADRRKHSAAVATARKTVATGVMPGGGHRRKIAEATSAGPFRRRAVVFSLSWMARNLGLLFGGSRPPSLASRSEGTGT
jgi:hypothetical protein